MMIFRTPNNFKMGKYILNKYKLKSFVLLIAAALLCVFLFVVIALYWPKMLNPFSAIGILLIFFIPYVLLSPIALYFNVATAIEVLFKHLTKTKEYRWEGIKYDEQE